MTLDQIRARHRELHRHMRSGDIAGAEQIAVELSPDLERLYDELDDRGIVLSWECDR